MILADPSVTLRLVLIPYVAATLAFSGLDYIQYGYFAGDVLYDPNAPFSEEDDTGFWPLAASLFAGFLCWVWLAVGWHRYVLDGDEPQGWLPRMHIGRLLRYFGKAILTALPTIPIFLIAMVFLIILETDDMVPFSTKDAFALGPNFTFFLVVAFATYVTFRFGPALPAAAMDDRLTLREAWRMTAPLGGTLVNLAIIITLIYIPLSAITNAFAANNVLYLAFTAASDVTSLLTLSVLTVLYGHLVQGRFIGEED